MPSTTTFTSFGQPEDVIELTELSSTDLKPGEIRLRMLVAPINPADINYIQGIYGIKPELPVTPGLEGCGEVIESQSDDFQTGDLIITLQPVGTWSEEITCLGSDVLKIPSNTPVDQASMLKVNPLTALCMLTQFAALPKGSWVIQNAANSGVGTCVIQIAKRLNLRTINLVRREEPIEPLLQLGADHVLLDSPESITNSILCTPREPSSIGMSEKVWKKENSLKPERISPPSRRITKRSESKPPRAGVKKKAWSDQRNLTR